MMRSRVSVNVAITLVVSIVFGSTSRTLAGSEGAIELRTIAESEVRTVKADGSVETSRVEAARVVPGDEVIYTIVYDNVGDAIARDVAITNPVPEHMRFSEAESVDFASTTFSIDGGATFDVAENLQVTDGEGRTRLALPEEYTHVRWQLNEPIAPGERGQLSFRARLE